MQGLAIGAWSNLAAVAIARRTCLKEAAIAYGHRHLNVVENKALYLGIGDTSNTFYLQMPSYKHGSVDKWVRGDQ